MSILPTHCRLVGRKIILPSLVGKLRQLPSSFLSCFCVAQLAKPLRIALFVHTPSPVAENCLLADGFSHTRLITVAVISPASSVGIADGN